MLGFRKKPTISAEEKGRVLTGLLTEVDSPRSIAHAIARQFGEDVAVNDPRVAALGEDLRLYGVPQDWKSKVADWWMQATPQDRTKALTETIAWVTSR